MSLRPGISSRASSESCCVNVIGVPPASVSHLPSRPTPQAETPVLILEKEAKGWLPACRQRPGHDQGFPSAPLMGVGRGDSAQRSPHGEKPPELSRACKGWGSPSECRPHPLLSAPSDPAKAKGEGRREKIQLAEPQPLCQVAGCFVSQKREQGPPAPPLPWEPHLPWHLGRAREAHSGRGRNSSRTTQLWPSPGSHRGWDPVRTRSAPVLMHSQVQEAGGTCPELASCPCPQPEARRSRP